MSAETSTPSVSQGVPIASLRVGLQLPFDIYEEDNVLLLSKGSVVTPKFLRHLQERKLPEIFIRNQDLKKLVGEARPTPAGGHVDLQTEHTKELDATDFVEPPLDGVALLASFKPRQPIPYDTAMLNQLIETRDNDVRDLSEQLTELVEGSNEMPGRSIEMMTTRYIWHMCQDLDATLSVSQMQRKENYIANHSLQLSVMGMALAAQLEYPQDEVRVTGISGLLHDVGMAKVPASILEAQRPLRTNEVLEVMKHPIHTLDMIEKVLGVPNRCRLIVYQVHERNNGRGYPRKRTGNKTYNVAKALGIVDAYLAMINDRPYRQAMLPYHAMAQILSEAREGFWDPRIVRAFVKLIGLFPVGSFVTLSDDSLAKVIRSGGNEFAKPHVTITHNADGVPQHSDTVIDLAQEPDGGLAVVKAIPPLYDYSAD